MPSFKPLIITLLTFCTFFLSAQDNDAIYSSLFVPSELKTKANAVVRYENITIDILGYDKLSVQEKRVVTIYNKYGNRHINAVEFYDGKTNIKKMEARIYDAFGEEIKKIRKNDFTDASAVSEISIYQDDRIKYLDYTPVKYPYTVEYTSEVVYNSTAFFPTWLPIDDYYLSIEHSEYKITNTANVQLKFKKQNFEDFNIESKSELHFLAKNVNAVKYEAYTPELKTFVPQLKVALKTFNMEGVDGVNNNWEDFGKWMYDRLLTGTDQIPEITISEVKKLTEGVEDKIERAKIVYEYMQNKTRYVSIQVGIGGWKPMLANDVDKLGYADCKGLSNYTKALLEAVNVPSYYTVVYGGSGIRSIDKEFSSVQGNHVILCVPNEDENIFLECTSQTSPFGFTAGFTDDRDVLLVKPEGGEIVHTKIYDTEDSVQQTTATINLNDTGGFKANVLVTTTGFQYSLHQGVETQTQKDQKLHYKEYWDNINGLDIESISIDNNKNEVIYKESVTLSASNYASKTGDRLILQPNMFNKVTSIPPRYLERKLEFKINRGFKDVDEFVITYPETLKIEALSEGKTITNQFGTYKFQIEALDNNQIKYTRTYILNKGSYAKEDYKAFRDFRKKIVKYDKTKIVLVKA